ncbi:MAG TPA: 16S rRNA (guanine(966)-N(2))-methyltransferase RsmD [Pyrinomonadaceae bacterium]|nr:16S rRNA (guanine(966)-N(2))-methyltransferase RsmD [Pyrinomonadaceae bacterium]
MRIIAGQYRGRNLKSPRSLEVRPTSDRLRETLFNILAPRIEESRFLDLCAGSGAVGIEALSRGAEHVTFVEQSRLMCRLIKENLELCRVSETQAQVRQVEARKFLEQSLTQESGVWDIVFFDPPYKDDYLGVLRSLGGDGSALLAREALVVVEHHHKNSLPETVAGLRCGRILKQGESALSFFQKTN